MPDVEAVICGISKLCCHSPLAHYVTHQIAASSTSSLSILVRSEVVNGPVAGVENPIKHPDSDIRLMSALCQKRSLWEAEANV